MGAFLVLFFLKEVGGLQDSQSAPHPCGWKPSSGFFSCRQQYHFLMRKVGGVEDPLHQKDTPQPDEERRSSLVKQEIGFEFPSPA